MRRIAVFRDGNMMAAMMGPDLVVGIAGFGETVPAALRVFTNEHDSGR